MNDIIKREKPSVLDISGVLDFCWSVLQTLQLVRRIAAGNAGLAEDYRRIVWRLLTSTGDDNTVEQIIILFQLFRILHN